MKIIFWIHIVLFSIFSIILLGLIILKIPVPDTIEDCRSHSGTLEEVTIPEYGNDLLLRMEGKSEFYINHGTKLLKSPAYKDISNSKGKKMLIFTPHPNPFQKILNLEITHISRIKVCNRVVYSEF